MPSLTVLSNVTVAAASPMPERTSVIDVALMDNPYERASAAASLR